MLRFITVIPRIFQLRDALGGMVHVSVRPEYRVLYHRDQNTGEDSIRLADD